MAIGLGAKLARLLLLTFNLIFWLSGVGLIGTGIWLLSDPEKSSVFAVVQTEGAVPMREIGAYGIIGIGCFVLLVGFLGCCGAMHENRCMLVTYFAVIVVILLAEIVAGILIVVYKNQLEEGLQQNMLGNLRNNYGVTAEPTPVTEGFDFIQFSSSCCGVIGPEDYSNSTWRRNSASQEVPQTCCLASDISNKDFKHFSVRPEVFSACQSQNRSHWYEQRFRHSNGCYEEVKNRIKGINGILIGVGAAVAALEVLGMIFAICLCRNIDYDI